MNNYVAPTNSKELVQSWLKRSRESQLAHYRMAETLSGRNKALGITTIILTSVAGLTSILNNANSTLALALGVASLTATFLASLQTFFKYEERATNHLNAGAKFAAARRQLELLACGTSAPNAASLEEIRKQLDNLSENSPNVPKKVFETISDKEAS